jgi:hypothetical protein
VNGVAVWTSDPVVTVDDRSGTFYLCALATAADSARNAVAVASGRFGDSGFTFENVVLARRAGRDTLPDKPWFAVDPASGNQYLSYTAFYGRGRAILDQIEFQRRIAGEAAWRPPIKLSPDVENGLVQGSRPAVGPDGELRVIWKLVDTTEANHGRDEIRIRSSRDAGEHFDAALDVASLFTNFGSGAPGYNRGFGFAFPGLAIDHSAGPTRGRIYVTWNESLDFFSDTLGTAGNAVEGAEPNDRTEVASPLTLGTLVHGSIGVPGDLDFYRFHGNAGQTMIAHIDSVATGLDLSLRLLSGDGQTWLAYCAPPLVRPRLIVFTLPITGDYFLGVGSRNDSTGAYRLATGLHREGGGLGRARDHRDVFVATSDDGVSWRSPVRVNAEAPRFDDWMPEVAVDPTGRAWVAWYDWHDAPDSLSGGGSVTYLARSIDGGATWQTMGPMSSVVTPWSRVVTNLAPNQGDYISLFAGDSLVTVAWSDGRAGDPDIYASAHAVSDEPIPSPQPPPSAVALELPRPNPTAGSLVVRFQLPATAPARVELLDAGGRPWRTVTLPAAAAGPMQVDLSAGRRLPPGLYFVRVAQGASSAAHKVVVVR